MMSHKQKRVFAVFSSIVGASILFNSLTAFSSTRTVCFEMRIRDERTNCAESSEVGVKRACNPGGYSDAHGFRLEVWDKDPPGNPDDFIGHVWIGGTGSLHCFSFDWTDSDDPDVYLKLPFQVRGVSDGAILTAVHGDGSSYGKYSWRDGPSEDPGRYVASNCQTGTTCYIYQGHYLYPTSDAGSDNARALMAIDSAQRALETFDSTMNQRTTGIDFYVDDLSALPWNCTTGAAQDRTTICMPFDSGMAVDGARQPHEVGHVLQMREFGQDMLRDACGSSWTVTGAEAGESCVTTEGFASYIGVVSWYDPSNTSVSPIYHGFNIENAQPWSSTYANNGNIPLQAMKFFWDMDDSNNEAAVSPATVADNYNNSTTGLLNVWDSFPDGTANRQDYENDDDGVNIRDFNFHTSGHIAILQHNCVDLQDDN